MASTKASLAHCSTGAGRLTGISLSLIALALVRRFNSVAKSLVLMLTVPPDLVGAFRRLALTGGDLWRPLAAVHIFGLLLAALLNLVILPVLYHVLCVREGWIKWSCRPAIYSGSCSRAVCPGCQSGTALPACRPAGTDGRGMKVRGTKHTAKFPFPRCRLANFTSPPAPFRVTTNSQGQILSPLAGSRTLAATLETKRISTKPFFGGWPSPLPRGSCYLAPPPVLAPNTRNVLPCVSPEGPSSSPPRLAEEIGTASGTHGYTLGRHRHPRSVLPRAPPEGSSSPSSRPAEEIGTASGTRGSTLGWHRYPRNVLPCVSPEGPSSSPSRPAEEIGTASGTHGSTLGWHR